MIMGLNWFPCQNNEVAKATTVNHLIYLNQSAAYIITVKNAEHKGCCLVCVPRRLSDQHGPVELALDVCVPRATGVDKRVDGDQDEALRVEFPDLNW